MNPIVLWMDFDVFGKGALQARLYDPVIGRWWSIDPERVKYPGISPYSYAANNPLIYTDRDGDVLQFIKYASPFAASALEQAASHYLFDPNVNYDVGAAVKSISISQTLKDGFSALNPIPMVDGANSTNPALRASGDVLYNSFILNYYPSDIAAFHDWGARYLQYSGRLDGYISQYGEKNVGYGLLKIGLTPDEISGMGVDIRKYYVNKIPDNKSVIGHIFQAHHHLKDTPENRRVYEDVANDPAYYMGQGRAQQSCYMKQNSDGTQIWVVVGRIGIVDAGLNKVDDPHKFKEGVGFIEDKQE